MATLEQLNNRKQKILARISKYQDELQIVDTEIANSKLDKYEKLLRAHNLTIEDLEQLLGNPQTDERREVTE